MPQKSTIQKVLEELMEMRLEVGQLKITQSDMLNKQDNYIRKQDEIIGLLENNDSIGKIGYIQKVDKLEERLGKVENVVTLTTGKVTFAVLVLGIVGGFVIKMWTLFK